MSRTALALVLAGTLATISACNNTNGGDDNTAQPGAAKEAAGGETIASGLAADSQFAKLAKAAGIDKTLAGPGPYTVLVPNDAAFGKLAPETADNLQKPDQRAQLTGVLTYHILPGVVLAEDIGKAIDNSKGKAMLATVGGTTLTATKEGGNIVLSDATGAKATIVKADEKRSNGVVHEVDTVLSPAAPS